MFKTRNGIAAWSAIYIILLCSLVMPLINILTLSLIMLPAVILYVKLDRKPFILYYVGLHAAVVILISLLFGGMLGTLPVIFSLFFLPPALVMGFLYRKPSSAKMVLISGVLALMGEMLLLLIICTLFGLNINAAIEESIRDSFTQFPELSNALTTVNIDQMIEVSKHALPMFIIILSFYYVVITHFLARRSLNKSGHAIPGLGPVRTWKLPKSIAWFYIISRFLTFFIDPESVSGLYVILLNLLPLLTFALAVQAIAFLFFVAHSKGWNKTMPIVGMILCPFVPNIMAILGILDIVFDIRKRFKSQ